MSSKVLIITNKNDVTSDFIVRELSRQKVPFYRLNTEEIGISVFLTFDFSISEYSLYDIHQKSKINLSTFTSVYYRRPKVRSNEDPTLTDNEREFLLSENYQTLEGLYKILEDKFWINPVYAIRNTENKIYQQIVAKKLGLKIVDGIVTNEEDSFRKFINRRDKHKFIVKAIRSGQIGITNYDSIVYTSELKSIPSDEEIKNCPTYLQIKEDKICDIRVTVVGDNIFPIAIDSQKKISSQTDWRKGQEFLNFKEIDLPTTVNEKCLEITKYFGLYYSAIDFVLNKNNDYIFLEINSNGQWAWVENRTSYRISQEMVKLLTTWEI